MDFIETVVSGTLAKKSNDIAKESLHDDRQKSAPVIKLGNTISIVKMDGDDLLNKQAFDTTGEIWDEHSVCGVCLSEYYAIKVDMENTGEQDISTITIDSMFVCQEDFDSHEANISHEIDAEDVLIPCIEKPLTRKIGLRKGESKTVYIAFPESDEEVSDSELYLNLNLKLRTVGNAEYEQNNVTGYYVDRKVVNSNSGTVNYVGTKKKG